MNPFTRDLGTQQGRIQPTGWTAPEGSNVFVLGYDAPGRFEPLVEGDYVAVSQTASFPAGAKLLRFKCRVRAPKAAAAHPWMFFFLVDGAVVLQKTINNFNAADDLVDVAANVSKFTGDRTVMFALVYGSTFNILTTEDEHAVLTEGSDQLLV